MPRPAQQGAPNARRSAAGEHAPTPDSFPTVIAVTLVAFLLARAAVPFVPSMALWGINVQRFLDPWWAWLPWLVAALALLPPVARVSMPFVEATGRAIVTQPLWAALGLGVAAGAIVFAFPDRLYFVGDFLIRLGGLRDGTDPTVLSPQAFPLDVWLHYTLPRWMQDAGWSDVHTAVRVIGASGAALLGVASVGFARSLRLSPAATVAAVATTLFGGYLCLYTGESKAFAEVCVVVIVFAGCAFTAVRSNSSWAWLGVGACLAVGIFLHRYVLGLLPATAVLAVLAIRAGTRVSLIRLVIPLALPAVAAAIMAPRIWRTIVTYDLGANFATAEVGGGGGMLAAALNPSRLLDVFNLVLFLIPVALFAVVAVVFDRTAGADPASRARREQAWLAASIAIPYAFVFLLARPPQGLVRDWDSFAAPAAAIAIWASWRLAVALEGARRPWLAVPLVATVATSSLQWLAHYADEPRGFVRLEALMIEPPQRPAVDRARTWDFLGWQYFGEERYEQSARAFEQAVAAAPSARNHTHWAMAETMTGRHDRALEIYLRAAERDSNLALAWFGVGVAGINSGDRAAVERAYQQLERLAPENDKTLEIGRWLSGP